MPQTPRAVLAGTALALLAACGAGAGAGAGVDAAPGARSAPPPPYALRLAGAGECTFPMKKQIADRPWALQRLMLDALWARTKGKGVRVAVIDTGVDRANPQLSGALDPGAGRDFLDPKGGDGTNDTVGHGTKVAGLIAARPQEGTGFVGLAPEATVIPIRQNDGQGNGNAATLAQAIDHAVAKGAQVINISQDTDAPLTPDSDLGKAVQRALDAKAVVVASAGNDGLDGQKRRTYPAAFPGVLAVASSDRNNERAAFSQPGDFIGVAAPGVDMVSTVPGFGQCIDNGTSFSAPTSPGSRHCCAPSTRSGPRRRWSGRSRTPPSAPSTAVTTTSDGVWWTRSVPSPRTARRPGPPSRTPARPRRPRPGRPNSRCRRPPRSARSGSARTLWASAPCSSPSSPPPRRSSARPAAAADAVCSER